MAGPAKSFLQNELDKLILLKAMSHIIKDPDIRETIRLHTNLSDEAIDGALFAARDQLQDLSDLIDEDKNEAEWRTDVLLCYDDSRWETEEITLPGCTQASAVGDLLARVMQGRCDEARTDKDKRLIVATKVLSTPKRRCEPDPPDTVELCEEVYQAMRTYWLWAVANLKGVRGKRWRACQAPEDVISGTALTIGGRKFIIKVHEQEQ